MANRDEAIEGEHWVTPPVEMSQSLAAGRSRNVPAAFRGVSDGGAAGGQSRRGSRWRSRGVARTCQQCSGAATVRGLCGPECQLPVHQPADVATAFRERSAGSTDNRERCWNAPGTACRESGRRTPGLGTSRSSGAPARTKTEVYSMDVGPIVNVFNALMTAGATLGLGATGFFVDAGRLPVPVRGRERARGGVGQEQPL